MDLLQKAFIYPPEPCEARFITDARTLTSTGLLNRNTRWLQW